jgi:glycosyltransferase involved in cell wall biosynthesis
MPDVMFVILGDGPEKAKLINLAETLGVTQYLNFKGDVSQEIVAKYMNAADVFVSLFDLSNVSNAVQEAMACGKCVLALNSGDTSTLVEHKQTGMLLELNQIPQLPAILKSLLKDENLRRQLGDNASKFANVHMPVWEVRAQNEVKLVEGLVQRGNLRIVTSG